MLICARFRVTSTTTITIMHPDDAGHRVTDAPTMAVARRVFEAANDQLAAEVVKGGLTAAAIKGELPREAVPPPQLFCRLALPLPLSVVTAHC